MQNSTNMRILELLRFLYERTDENHPATVSDIIAHLNGKGIQAVRQTVYADTNALIDAGIDIVVVKSTQNQYFMGNRLFEYPELKMLTDAVASSKIISAKKSEELVQKLCRLTSLHQAKQLQKFAALSSRVKPHNEKVYYIIDNIQTAIGNHQQIRFQYYEYTQEKKKILKHDGYYYVVNPYALEWKNDHYYLIGFSLKHQKIAHFRVDRLTSVENLETYFMPIEGFDVASYTNKMVDMFTSESSKEVTLLCENELMRVKKEIDELMDLFGDEYIDNNLVFCSSNGRPMESQVINRAFNKLIKENGLPHVVFHSLRHSSITYKLKLNGGDMKSVQGDSGHAQVKMVADVYSHIIDEDRCINAQRLEEAFYSSKTPDPVEDTEPKTADTAVTESDESDAAKILELLKNPETAALLKQLAKAL